MNSKVIWLSLIAIVLSFAGGFLLANALNRSELNSIKAENDRLKTVQNEAIQTNSESTLAADEIQQKIAEADKNSTDIAYQRNLGSALYRYAIVKQDAALLDDVSRILERVYKADEKDYETIVMLGNIRFDIGYFKKENEQFKKAREFYQKALEQKPNDIDVRTDLGLTYFLETPPETEKAIFEFQKSLKENHKHEKTLQVLTQAFIGQNKLEEAEKYLLRLKQVNQNNPALADLTTQLEQAKSNSQKQ